jgi:hypothetical protein
VPEVSVSQLVSGLWQFSLALVARAGTNVLLLALVALFHGTIAFVMPLLTLTKLRPSRFSANFAITRTGWGVLLG